MTLTARSLWDRLVSRSAQALRGADHLAIEGCVLTGIGLSSVGGAVEWLRKHFRPAAAEGLEVTYRVDLSGSAGGSLWVRISAGQLQCGEGVSPQADVILRMGAEEFFGVLAGTANPDLLFMDDRIEIEGDLSLALKLRSIFSREA